MESRLRVAALAAIALVVALDRSSTLTAPRRAAAAAGGLASLPADLMPVVIDTVQRSTDPSFAPVRARGASAAIARNETHGLTTRFSARRVDVAGSGDATFARPLVLSARTLTLDGAAIALSGERIASETARIAYAHAPAQGVRFDEWFTNGPLGLQHGFDVKALPAGVSDLHLAIDVGNDWLVSPAEGAPNDAVEIRAAGDGPARLSYRYLRAWDRTGRFLPARLEAADHSIRLAVNVRGAELPITIDPLLQQGILQPPGVPAGSGVGTSVAVRGNHALVGAPFVSVGGNAAQGVVYLFERDATTGLWGLRETLTDASGQANDWFGYSVALADHGHGAIGAPLADPGGVSNGGKVYKLWIYDGSATGLNELGSARATDDLFGWSVAAEGDDIAAGAYQDTAPAFGQGTVEMWGYLAGTDEYGRLATLAAPGFASLDHFGYSVAMSGDTVVVGAPDVNRTSPAVVANVGAAYVYVYDSAGDTYTLQARLDPPGTPNACENFGGSVAISGERIVVGSGLSAESCTPSGPGVATVYEFTRTGTAWTFSSALTASDCSPSTTCRGATVSLAASLLTIGLPNEAYAGVASGTVKTTRRTSAGWSAFQRLSAPGLVANSRFGRSVAATASLALAGLTGAPGQAGLAPILGPSSGDLVPAVGDGVRGNYGSVNGWRQRLNEPWGVAYDGANSRLYVADTYNHQVKRYRPDVDGMDGRLGIGTQGSGGDGSFASIAQLSWPLDVAVDGNGRIYIADSGNSKIRRVDGNLISTFAGTGVSGFSGDNGPATSAQISPPYGVGVDAAGNLYIADFANHRIRRVNAATNIITTIAGTGTAGYNGDGIPATSAQLNFPRDVEVAPNGAIYIADSDNNRVRRIDPVTNVITTVLGTGVAGYSGDGQPGSSAQIRFVPRITIDSAGNLYAVDMFDNRIRRVAGGTGNVDTVAGIGTPGTAGEGGPATSAELDQPYSAAVTPAGTFVAEINAHRVRRITPAGMPLALTRAGSGAGTVTFEPGSSCAASCTVDYPLGTAVTLVATADATSTFTGWSGACTGTGTCSLTMNQARGVTATFMRNPQQLTVNLAGSGNGSVTSNPAGISCSPTCTTTFAYNTVVTLTPSVGADSTFGGWSGACAGTGACSVTMNQARSVTATFTGNPQTLTVSLSGDGTGSVSSAPAGISCGADCGETYPYNTSVTLTASSGATSTFTGWSGACLGAGACTVTMTQARSVTATFTGNPQTVTVSLAGDGAGSVASNPAGIACGGDCAETYPYNTSVTLTASAAGGSTFIGWSGDCSGTGSCTVTTIQARNVAATFSANPRTLTVNVTGSGTVSSTPAGISCNPTCTATFPSTTSVTLTATAGVGSTFSGWSGDCTGPSACTVSMNQARSINASFTGSSGQPTIATRSPARGSTRGGTVVVLTGQNFIAGTTVRVGTITVPVLLAGTTELSFVTPAASVAGTQTITLQTTAGQATTPFEYADPTLETHDGWRRPAFAIDRYTAFETALPLLPEDTNGVSDIYVHDDVTDTLRRVSISATGREAIGGESTHAAISATGRFIAFESLASNLVYSDTNGLSDVFLHDRDADEDGVFDELGGIGTIRISVSSAGLQAIGGGSTAPSISGNGRSIAFQSSATNLVAGDGNGVADVFVHDRLLGRTVRASIATDGATPTVGASARPAISQNGRFIAFDSAAVLTAGDTNAARDVFVHDRDPDGDGVMDEPGAVATRRVSVASDGAPALGGDSVDPSITGDGRYVVFASSATTLVAGDTNGVSDVFLQDRDVDADGVFDEPGQIATRRVTVGAGGSQSTVASGTPHISANGKLLVFLVANATGSAPMIGGVTAAAVASDPGKSVPWTQPDPTNPLPPPPGKSTPGPGPDPGPDTDTDDVATSPDGDRWGGTDVTDVPKVIIIDEPAESEPSPAIAVVSPGQGSSSGVTLVTIEGRDFAGTLYWNDTPLTPVTQTSTRWTVVAPPRGGAPATVSIYFRVADRRSNVETFTYLPLSAPRWTGHAPLAAPLSGNVPLTISGTGFSDPGVTIGRLTAVVTAWNPTSITATVPSSYAAGPMPLTVTNGDGADTTSEEPFIYQNAAEPLSVLRLEPRDATITGGTAITLYGGGFTNTATVAFGARPASSVEFVSSRTLVVVAPPAPPGSVDVIVRVPGQEPVTIAFGYSDTPPPVPGCAGADGDGDGMDDAWEEQYGLVAGDAADGSEDPDHDRLTSAQECLGGSHPRSFYTRYLAEGATSQFFDTLIAISNPNWTPARVLLRFQTSSGGTPTSFLRIPPMSRRSIRPATRADVGSTDFSTVVESDVQVVVDRTMSWGMGAGTGIYGSHAETSLTAPQTEWYLAEGATHGAFDLFYLLQNPGPIDAVVRIRFLRPAGFAPIEHDYAVPAHRRVTLNVDAVPGLEATDVSAVFRSLNGVPIIVERAMYRTVVGPRPFESGHDSAAIPGPSTHWFLAEGATGAFFDTFLLLANPNDATADVGVTYLLPGGATVSRAYQVAGNSRRTIYVAGEAAQLAATSVSTVVSVTNDVPIIAERAMWWPGGQAAASPGVGLFWSEAHNSPGATETGTKWAVADGETGVAPAATATYYLVANTSSYAADVVITLLSDSDSPPLTRHFSVPANSRFTVGASDAFPETQQATYRVFGAVIESQPVGGQLPAQIVVERAMYSNSTDAFWAAGSNLLATRLR